MRGFLVLRELNLLITIVCMPLITTVSSLFELHAAVAPTSSPFAHGSIWALTTKKDTDAVPVLGIGDSIEGELSGDRTDSYQVQIDSGQYFRAVVGSIDVTIVVAFFEPSGVKIAEFRGYQDRPIPLSMIANRAGRYRLELRLHQESSNHGRYRLKIEEVRPATRHDRSRVAAEKASAEAEQLRAEWRSEFNRRAIERYEQALVNWRAAGEPREESTALRNIGEVYDLLGELHKALQYFNRSLLLSQNVNDPREEGETLNAISSVYLHLGKNQEALEYCTRALNLSRDVSNRRGEAQALNSLGEVYYGFGNVPNSIKFHDQALALWLALNDRRGEADSLLYLGYNYLNLCDTQRALESFKRALLLGRALGDPRRQALTLTGIGHLYSRLGEKQEALDLYNQATELAKLTGDNVGKASILNGMGYVYEQLGEKQRALEYYRQALRLLQAAGLHNQESQALLMTIGDVHSALGDDQIALNYYLQALSVSRALPNQQMESYALRNIGTVYESRGRKTEALDYYKRALSLKPPGEDDRWEAYILNNIADVHHGMGDKQKALGYYKQALALNRAAGDRFGETVTLCSIARVERDLGNLQEGLAQLQAALKIIESLRGQVVSRELRTSYFASEHERYDFYIDLLMRLHKERPSEGHEADALQASERARARSLVESLAEARADIRQGVDHALLERERLLRQLLSDKADRQMRLSGKPDKQEAEALAKEISDLTNEYDQVQAEIKSKSPRYAALTQPQPLSLKEIQEQVLDDNSLLLEYSLGDEHSYLWAVTDSRIDSYELPKRAEIEKMARRVYELLVARQPKAGETARLRQARVSEADAKYWQEATALSQMLLGPVAQHLGTKRLLIVADGALQYLPFGALPAPQAQCDAGTLADAETRRHGDTVVPLMVDHEIVNLPSASVLAVLRRETRDRRAASKAVAVLADPVFDADDPRVVAKADMETRGSGDAGKTRRPVAASPHPRVPMSPPHHAAPSPAPSSDLQRALRDVRMLRQGGLSIPRLLSSREEADAIMAVAPEGAGMKATDFKASRATATSPELGQYRIVHFATHGLLNSDHPELSGLVLSLVDEQGQRQDGFLRLHDIYNLNLPVDLVVLSACDTGLGKDVRGEGLVGIVRGFMYAGAARVVASLWKVDDESTAELMKRFYQQMLQGGRTPSAALRAAQVEMWQQKRWRSPYYWAAFVLQGEWK